MRKLTLLVLEAYFISSNVHSRETSNHRSDASDSFFSNAAIIKKIKTGVTGKLNGWVFRWYPVIRIPATLEVIPCLQCPVKVNMRVAGNSIIRKQFSKYG